jgi:hypothetical protein
MVCSVWRRAVLDIGQRQPLQEPSCATIQKELKAKQHFTTAKCPWSNGTIESACKQLIRAFRAVLSELMMYAEDWPEVVNMIHSYEPMRGGCGGCCITGGCCGKPRPADPGPPFSAAASASISAAAAVAVAPDPREGRDSSQRALDDSCSWW